MLKRNSIVASGSILNPNQFTEQMMFYRSCTAKALYIFILGFLSSKSVMAQPVYESPFRTVMDYTSLISVEELEEQYMGTLYFNVWISESQVHEDEFNFQTTLRKHGICHAGYLSIDVNILIDGVPHVFVDHYKASTRITDPRSSKSYDNYKFIKRYLVPVDSKPTGLANLPFKQWNSDMFHEEYLEIDKSFNTLKADLSRNNLTLRNTNVNTGMYLPKKFVGGRDLTVEIVDFKLYEYDPDIEDSEIIAQARDGYLDCIESEYDIAVDREKYWSSSNR